MSAWNQGYVTDVEYTYGYYGELNPARAAFALAYAGIAAPEVSTACELGFGQGVSVSLHSAAQATQWWGTDFNPQHAAFAQGLSGDGASAARLTDQSFADFCTRTDLPDFDFIGLHGIWTWISKESHEVVVDFIRRKLRVGGVLYISYNTYPGWSDIAPVRQLLKRHVEVMASRGEPLFTGIDKGVEFLGQLMATNPSYMRAAPRAVEQAKSLAKNNKNYIAHEYLTKDWHTMYFAEFSELMEPAKVSFACSSHPLDAVDIINLTPEQQALLNGIADPEFRESVRDYCVNQQFRRDLWVKGARKLNVYERAEAVRRQRVILFMDRASVELKVRGSLGEAALHAHIYNPLLDHLADGAAHTVADLEAAGRAAGITDHQVFSAIQILVGMGVLQVAQDPAQIEAAKPDCARLNALLVSRADTRPQVDYLASPVTGGGIPVSRFQQLFVAAIADGAATPQAWAAHAWARIEALGQKLLKDGQLVEAAEENLAELTRQAEEFQAKRLPVLRALGIV